MLLDTKVISTCSEEIKQFLFNEENRLKIRESTIQNANDTFLENKWAILKEIEKSKLTLAETEFKLETKMNESCTGQLKTFWENYSNAAKDFYKLKDLKNLSEHADLEILSKYEQVYFKINVIALNKKSDTKSNIPWNWKIAIKEIADGFENELSAILEEIEKGRNDKTLNSEIFVNNIK